MNTASDAGVIGVNGAKDFDRTLGIGDGSVVHQSLFQRAGEVVVTTRTDVPGGRNHELEVVDLAVLDVDPMAQCAARSVDITNTLCFGRHVPIFADIPVALDRKSVV